MFVHSCDNNNPNIHLRDGQVDTDDTVDLVVMFSTVVSWSSTETLASWGSGRLPEVFSLQEQGNEPKSKFKNPVKDDKPDLDVMSKLWTLKNIPATKSCHPTTLVEVGNPGSLDWREGNDETVAKRKQKWPHPDLPTKTRIEEETGAFKRVVSETKDRQWKQLLRHTTHLFSSGNSTYRWKALAQPHQPWHRKCKRSGVKDTLGKG